MTDLEQFEHWQVLVLCYKERVLESRIDFLEP